jgi:DNA (cytosine-5)-methyltransferase 1
MAGIKVVASYDVSAAANKTNAENNRHPVYTADVRSIKLAKLPRKIDVVVGSPPCTQFSFANRGGAGDLSDGLEDILSFLKVVAYLKPRFWVLENVPRVKKIFEKEVRPGGRLSAYARLGGKAHLVNMEDYGLPQRRQRCLIGNIDFRLLQRYAAVARPLTLGDVIRAMKAARVIDPIYGIRVAQSKLIDHIREDFLDAEEERINNSAKTAHPVYNSMPFPDPLVRSSRTITSTCTRVSRESIVITTGSSAHRVRRLTLRERASLQGFPITFQFYGTAYGQKLLMIGNAIPPLFTYYVGQAMNGREARGIPSIRSAISCFRRPPIQPESTPPGTGKKRFPKNRTFRFAIPSLRLKSGVRFELANKFDDGHADWEVAFYFGTSKSIHQVELDHALYKRLLRRVPSAIRDAVIEELDALAGYIRGADVKRLQNVWNHSGPGGTAPFVLLDRLSEAGSLIISRFAPHNSEMKATIARVLKTEFGNGSVAGTAKVFRNSGLICAGLLVGSIANYELGRHAAAASGEAMRRAANQTGR